MYIPTQYLPVNTNKAKPVKRNAVTFDKSESHQDTAKKMLNSHVLLYEKREGEDRRKRNIKPLLCTRSGRDRRFDEANPPISIKA